MVKIIIFAIILASTPVSGLMEAMFRVENGCYSGCHTNYAASVTHFEACRSGCDFKLLSGECSQRCESLSKEDDVQFSCKVGCSLIHNEEITDNKPVIAIDPVPEVKEEEKTPEVDEVKPEAESQPETEAQPETEPERPKSIIIIRLRQRPFLEMPPPERFMNMNPMQMFNDMIQRFKEKADEFEESIKSTMDEKLEDLPRIEPGEPAIEPIPPVAFIRLPNKLREDSSSSESSEEERERQPFVNEIQHIMTHSREHHRYMDERPESNNGHLHRFLSGIRNEWDDITRDQPKIPVWIFLCILISSSIILWYMLMSLCRHTPSSKSLSVRAQELVFHPHGYEAYSKEKIQPDDEFYEVTEPMPIKVKLSTI